MSQVGFDSQGIIPMIAGGESWYAFTQGVGVYAKFAFQDQSQTAVTMSPYGGTPFPSSLPFSSSISFSDFFRTGLGSFSFGLLDTHFSQRGRQGRAIAIGWTQSSPRVFGIDENTAIIVTNATSASDVNMRVVGEYGVSIFDLQGSSFLFLFSPFPLSPFLMHLLY
jgi:cyanophycinase-like exopeptidase